jgi:hypothetical protein
MFDKTKQFADLKQKIETLEEANRNLQRQLPDGVAGMAGLAIANYFSQWEQTGYDPFTQIPVQDVDSIERSAVTQAINKVALQVLGELKPEILVLYAHKLNPELVENQLKRVAPDELAKAIITFLPHEFVSEWVAANCSSETLIKILNTIEASKSGNEIAREELQEKGIFNLTSLPVGTTVQLLFDEGTDNYGKYRTNGSSSYLRPGNVSRWFYSRVNVIVTMGDANDKYIRVDEHVSGKYKNTSLQRQIRTSICDSMSLLGHDNMSFDHSYVAYQTIGDASKKVKLGILVDAVVIDKT